MATKFCAKCGSEYLASVDECPDCELPLVDDRPTEAVDTDASGEIEYELHEWSSQTRGMLEQLLVAEDIPRAWEGADLVIPAAYEARVDALLEEVEAAAEPVLDPDAPKVAYDIEDWSDARQSRLLQALTDRDIPFEIDGDGALVVLEEHEAVVEEVLDAVEAADEDDEDDEDDEELDEDDEELDDEDDEDDELEDFDGDEPLAMDVMSDLFVAADRLMHSATDAEAVLSLVARAEDAARMPVPYGFDKSVWKHIAGQATDLKATLEDDDSTDEAIEEKARDLRAALRSYV